MSKKHWVQEFLREQFVPKRFRAPKIFWVQVNFETSQTPSQYPPDTLSIPCKQQSDTFQTPFGHSPHTLKTPTKFQAPVLYKSLIFNQGRGGWVVGRSPVQNHATSWSNLQDCKISSRVEIPKLDRVWQSNKIKSSKIK